MLCTLEAQENSDQKGTSHCPSEAAFLPVPLQAFNTGSNNVLKEIQTVQGPRAGRVGTGREGTGMTACSRRVQVPKYKVSTQNYNHDA